MNLNSMKVTLRSGISPPWSPSHIVAEACWQKRKLQWVLNLNIKFTVTVPVKKKLLIEKTNECTNHDIRIFREDISVVALF
jgi:hypothetical protein